MGKSSKELAVELTKAWTEMLAGIAANPNVTNMNVPTKENIAAAFDLFYGKVSEKES